MRSWSVTSTLRDMHRYQKLAVLVNKRSLVTGSANNQGGQRGNGGDGRDAKYARYARYAATGAAATAAAFALTNTAFDDRMKLCAKEKDAVVDPVIVAENRMRQFSTPDKIFNFFASYQFVSKDESHGLNFGRDGRRVMMMTPLEFFSSITPDCTLAHAVGAGAHVEVTQQELDSKKIELQKSPLKKSVLNDIGDLGLLSYADFSVLLAILSTPRRYIDTVFNLFDVTGDGSIVAKEFAYVSTKMAHKSGGFGSYTDIDQEEILASSSGLLNYLFGKARDKELSKESFRQLQKDLLEEIIELEFLEYDKTKSGRISEGDFVQFLLKNGKITPKKKNQLIKKIESRWPKKGRGVSLPSFKSFFYVLAGSLELERALFYLDVEGIGVDKEEFRKISSWVSGMDTSDHVVNVIFELLDDDEDGRIYRDDIAQVLLDWRHSRGYDKGSIHVTLGQIRV